MDIQGISASQIITVGIFLFGLFALKIFVTKNKSRLPGSWKANNRIKVIEEKALSASEKLRIVSVDTNQFLIISNKGKKSSLIPLSSFQKASASLADQEYPNKENKQIKNPIREGMNRAINSPTKSPSQNNRESHQLSRAIQTAREMNPAVSYNK
jgi:flagellar biogenesis protein FliO